MQTWAQEVQHNGPTRAELEYGEIRQGCDTGNGVFRFVPDADPEPDPVVVAIERATRMVPLPEPGVNPPLDSGGIVNLGMWLAVANPQPVDVTATGRGTSVTVVATLATTEFDMGDGTTVECEGGGVPIDPNSPDWDSVEAGPCGHTYADRSRGGPFEITITTTWVVTWAATDGRSGTAPDVVRTASFPYDVREIQTVGTGG